MSLGNNELIHVLLFSEQIEGYGADRSDDVGVFPFSSPPPKDDTAEFRRQLKHMGGSKASSDWMKLRAAVIGFCCTLMMEQ